MKINNTIVYIRQQQPGNFRRPEDGRAPHAHVNNQKLESTKEQKKCSVYIKNENLLTLENDLRSYSQRLFDFDAGAKLNTKKVCETDEEEKSDQQYDKTGKMENLTNERDSLIDQWG